MSGLVCGVCGGYHRQQQSGGLERLGRRLAPHAGGARHGGLAARYMLQQMRRQFAIYCIGGGDSELRGRSQYFGWLCQ